jgi:gliding motility-associated-like protein
MNRLLSLLICFVALAQFRAQAQLLPPNQPEQNACQALMLCGNTFTSPYGYQGIGTVSDLTNTPCSGGEGNSMWLRLEITQAGSIVFTITPIIPTDDYDFAVVDATVTGCAALSSTYAIRCNFNNNQPGSNVNGAIGLNSTSTINTVPGGTFGNSFCQQINANVGDVYLIMINNFGYYTGVGGPTSGFTIDFTGSTAVFNQPAPPKFKSVQPYCDLSQEITLELSDYVLCSSIAANGSDFSLYPSGSIQSVTGVNCTGPSGYTDKIKITFNGTLPNGDYTLRAQTGSDGNTLLGLCNAPLALPDSVNFHVGQDPIAFLSIDSPACRILKINLNSPVACNSIAANGSDFVVLGPSNVTVASATGVGCIPGGFTSSLLITLAQPIAVDGIYRVRAQVGSDGNTVIDSCGRIVPPNLEIPFVVNSFNGLLQAMPDTTICNVGSVVNLYGTNNGPAPASGFQYQWVPSTGVQNPQSMNTQLTIQDWRNYYILETVDANGCYLRDSAKILVKPFHADLNPTVAGVCDKDGIQLVASGGESYAWFNNPNLTGVPADFDCTNCPDPLVKGPLGINKYYVLVTNDVGCKDTLMAEITVNPLPDIEAFPVDTTIKYGSSITLLATGGQVYSWTPTGSLNDAYSPTPVATPRETTHYVAMGANEYGCIATDTAIVRINFRSDVLVPSAFSPNGDGLNDEFKVANIKYQKLLEFRVFDRWGNMVYEGNNPARGWDGTYKGQPAPTDVYFYTIRLGYADNYVETFTGDVTLIR